MPDAMLPPPLRYFLAIAREGSLTAAARAVGVSQPSLSVAIRKLEEDLETTLLIRGRRGVRLTKTGEVLLQHARHTARALELARQEIHALEQEPRGSLVLGCHESLGGYALPGFMSRFLEAYPGIRLTLWNGNSSDVQRQVVERVVDVGLVVNPAEHPDCVIQELFQDRVELMVSSALSRRRKRGAGQIFERHPLIYVPAIRQCQFLAAAVEQAGHEPRHLGCSSMELVKSLVLDGVGVGILPWRVATHGVSSGRLSMLTEELPCFEDRICLVRRFDAHVTRASRLLWEALREHGRKMPALPERGAKRRR